MADTPVEDMQNRIADHHIAFVAYVHNEPAAFGWMATTKAEIGELNHELVLPEKHRYLWNFRTLAPYRGLGIYPALLQYIMQHEADMAQQFWIIHAPENKSSLKGIVKSGFEYVGKLYTKPDGVVALETNGQSALYHNFLKNFNPSTDGSASCWNCNSPYLKKRVPSCCCAQEEIVCTGDIRILTAA